MIQNARRFGLLAVGAAVLALALVRGPEARPALKPPAIAAGAESASETHALTAGAAVASATPLRTSTGTAAKDVDPAPSFVELEAAGASEEPPGARVHPAFIVRRHGPAPLDRRHPSMARAIEIQERHFELLENPAVVGTAVGLNDQGEIALLVCTKAPAQGIPATLEGLPVAVWRTGEFAARDESKRIETRAASTTTAQRFERAVPIGVSTGHPSITAGTIGCRVTNGTQVFALSNNHVYANENKASLGDAALQPGSYDYGVSPTDGIGTLSDFQTIIFGGSPVNPKNEIDAAIALTTEANLGTGTPSGIGYGTPSATTIFPAAGAQVTKVGRTTGHTVGTVSAVNMTSAVSYDSGVARFKHQIIITPGSFSAGGDSGSLIVTNDGKRYPVGLLFAGGSTTTIANEIGTVLKRFGVTIDDRETDEAPSVTIATPADNVVVASGASVTFTGSAVDAESGDVTASLAWSSSLDGPLAGLSPIVALSDGLHTITATATDGLRTGSASIKVVVGGSTATAVAVSGVSYATEGGKTGDRNLLVTVALRNNLGAAVSGASVSIALTMPTGLATGTATTGAGGTVTFSLRNAPSGVYSTDVTSVIAAGLTWDGETPPNAFTK